MGRSGTGCVRATTAGFASLVLLAGCGSDRSVETEPVGSSSPEPTSAPSVSPEPTGSATPTTQNEQILAQYREFFARQAEISRAAAAEQHALLAPYAADPALTSVLDGLTKAAKDGRVGYGAAKTNPRVVKAEQDTATVDDCQDNTDSGEMEADTGKKLTRGTDRDHVVTAMRRGNDGTWRVTFVDVREDSC